MSNNQNTDRLPNNGYISAAYAIYLLQNDSAAQFFQGEGPFKQRIYRIRFKDDCRSQFKLNQKSAEIVKSYIKSKKQ